MPQPLTQNKATTKVRFKKIKTFINTYYTP